MAVPAPPRPPAEVLEEECLICLHAWRTLPAAYSFNCRCRGAAVMCWRCVCALAGLQPATGAPLPGPAKGPVECPLCSADLRGAAVVGAAHPGAARAPLPTPGTAAPAGVPLPTVPRLPPPPPPPPRGLRPGDWVRVKPAVVQPRYNWGRVRPGEVGIVASVGEGAGGDVVHINFPSQRGWAGVAEEMERVPPPF